ncbi:MAG TPA: D-alanyl-D-alanine carboxypeptidase family protein, partial [Dongiaceae bacterium]|nr:D-alanyl-D-alanine carboxypeptidase family protein [Dongiaceae bacterium]
RGIPAVWTWSLTCLGLVLALLSPLSPSFAAIPISASIVVDAASGQVLSQSNADMPTYPASLTKMMTLYLTFEALQKGKITFDEAMPVSALAASQPPTKLGLYPGQTITVAQAVRGMIIKSANDAAMVMGEALGSSVDGFAQRMNAKAQALGMTRTLFRNPNGLPNFEQHTTARDLARLAIALYRDFPQYYPLFADTRFTFRGRVYLTHNRFMLSYPGADGLKTGYINASGYNLAASATRNGRHIVGVVLGGRSPTLRDAEMWALLDQGFGSATPAGSNNALLLASAAALPSLKPGDAEGDGGAEDDSLEDGSTSPTTNAMQAALPPTPAPAPKAAATVVASTATAPTVGYTAPSTAPAAPVIELQVLQPPAAPAQQPTTLPAPSKLAVLPALKPGAADTTGAGEANGSLATGTRTWGIQVGAYNRYASARKAALRARAKLPAGSPQTRIAVDESRGANGKLYRARLIGFAQAEAAQACRALKARKLSCMVIPTNMAVAETSQ